MGGDLDESLLVGEDEFRQHAVTRAAELLHPEVGLDASIAPTWKIGGGDPVAGREPCHALADSDDHAGSVADRHHALRRRQWVLSAQNEEVAVVERSRVHAYERFPRARLRHRIVTQHDSIRAAELV